MTTTKTCSPTVSKRRGPHPFDVLAQRKVEYENYRFKYPSLLAVVIESINVKVVENQKMIGKWCMS